MNTVKIIATWGGRRINGEGYPEESGPMDAMSMLKYNIEKERELDYGAKMDLIIVNAYPLKSNFSKDPTLKGEKGLKAFNSFYRYLNSLDGQLTPNGKITVLNRRNEGFSFGSYNHAYQKYKDKYDYWFFSEDDTITVLNNFMSISVEALENDRQIGFVSLSSNRVLSKRHYHRRTWGIERFALGGIGVMSKEKINFIIKKWGVNNSLPVYRYSKPDERFARQLNAGRRVNIRYNHDGRDGASRTEIFFTGLLSPTYRIVRINTIEPFNRSLKPYIRWRNRGGNKINCKHDIRYVSWNEDMIRF